MTTEAGFSSAARFLLVAGAFVVVVAGMKAASSLVTPFLLAGFIAVIAAPPMFYLKHRGAPTWVALGYLVVNMVAGNLLEPRYMGRGLGLSTLVVFVSLVFWGWVLGPVSMFLSVPLTMVLKIALDANPQTRPLAIILGPDIETAESGQAPDEQAAS